MGMNHSTRDLIRVLDAVGGSCLIQNGELVVKVPLDSPYDPEKLAAGLVGDSREAAVWIHEGVLISELVASWPPGRRAAYDGHAAGLEREGIHWAAAERLAFLCHATPEERAQVAKTAFLEVENLILRAGEPKP